MRKKCYMCNNTIEHYVNQKINEGWFEWAVNPDGSVYVCSVECHDEWDRIFVE
jgi:hypothetical protein